MKKIVGIIFVFLSLSFIYYNVTSVKINAMNIQNDKVSLTLLNNIALAASECSKSEGDPVYGTDCYVERIIFDDADWYFTFNTIDCSITCERGGTNCCFELSHY